MNENLSGRIFQINASPEGGVPKLALRVAQVGMLGIISDLQEDKINHGGPDRALCLYPLERILALRAEGHPIFPGAVGENITTIGIDPASLRPGAQLSLGPDVVLEITTYTMPCRTIKESFSDENFKRISQDFNPGWSRVYARVLSPGKIRVGDLLHTIINLESK